MWGRKLQRCCGLRGVHELWERCVFGGGEHGDARLFLPGGIHGGRVRRWTLLCVRCGKLQGCCGFSTVYELREGCDFGGGKHCSGRLHLSCWVYGGRVGWGGLHSLRGRELQRHGWLGTLHNLLCRV